MPRLDPIIGSLFAHHATELVFESGALPVLRTPKGEVQPVRQALGAAQLRILFTEVAPENHRAGFPQSRTSTWSYEAPGGKVHVTYESSPERTRAVVRRMDPVTGSQGPVDKADLFGAPGAHAAEPAAEVSRPQLKLVGAADPARPLCLPVDPAQAMVALLRWILVRRASDLHLTAGSPPIFRIDGEITPEPGVKPLTPEFLKKMLWSMAPERNQTEFEQRHDSDFAYELDEGRFRVNLFRDRNGVGAVLRHIPTKVLTSEELNLPQAVVNLTSLQKGLVLVTGPTGSGKSTTLAALIDHINRTRSDHIITIEDPIEFVHQNRKCLVNQREVGVHTRSFKDALRAALREDPDVVLVGELRDLETISIAMETAETGHLVFGTLHTNTAPSTIERITDQFPADRQEQVRVMLSESLKGVISQTLCKRQGGGRVAALEILVGTSGVSNLIREGKAFQIASAMQTGRSLGMQTLNDALLELVKAGTISAEEAMKRSVSRAEMKSALDRLPSPAGANEAAA